jgi:hypothetical protein
MRSCEPVTLGVDQSDDGGDLHGNGGMRQRQPEHTARVNGDSWRCGLSRLQVR